MGRISIVVALCLVLSACASSGPVTGTTEPLRAPADPETTTSQPVVPESPPSLDWSSADLDFGVSQIMQVGSALVGLAVQDFVAPSSLLEEGDTGCLVFQAGRTGEIVWSTDGFDWAPLPAQPYWYEGPLSPEHWTEAVRIWEIPPNTTLVELVSSGDRLLAISFNELTETQASAVVDSFDLHDETWRRLGSLGAVGSNRFVVAAAAGPDNTIVMAAGPDRDPGVWAVDEAGLVELTSWNGEADSVELVGTDEGYLAQFEDGSGDPVMAFIVDGADWTRVAHPSAGPVHLAASGTVVLAMNGDGLWRSTDRGGSWQPVPMEPGVQLAELVGSSGGFAAWLFTEGWMSPEVWHSRDGVEWEQMLELSEDHGWINGILLTDDALVVSATVPTDGWGCSEIEGSRYEIHRVPIER